MKSITLNKKSTVEVLLLGKTRILHPVEFIPPFEDHLSWKSVYPWGNGWVFFGSKFKRTPQEASDFLFDAYGPSEYFKDGFVCPIGKAKDKLWVKEAWSVESHEDGRRIVWRADSSAAWLRGKKKGNVFYLESGYKPIDGWQEADLMPRWASRVDVRIQSVEPKRIKSKWFWELIMVGTF